MSIPEMSNHDERPEPSSFGKRLLAAFTQINARPLTDWQRELEHNELAFRSLFRHRHRLLGREWTPEVEAQFATWARRACDLMEPDRRIEAMTEVMVQMFGECPSAHPHSGLVREGLARYEAIQSKPVECI